jgi:5-oxoprolinase (ATP-hydrolysing) subunit A
VIDLNCDMGEGAGFDEQLLAVVSSANVACGFHAGGPRTMDRTVAMAVANGVTIGAHVSYPDRSGFGRRHMVVSEEDLAADVLFQIGALEAFCRRYDTPVRYVKAHGALYNDFADDRELAAAFGRALVAHGGDLAVLALAGSPSVGVLAGLGLRVVPEAFADRAYTSGGRLVARSLPGAVITDAGQVADRACAIAAARPIETIDGSELTIEAGSLCVHGDTPGAVQIATAIRRALSEEGIEVAPFA